MPFKIDIFAPDRILVGVVRGNLTAAGLMAFVESIDAAGVPHYRKIIDVTSATPSMSTEELTVIAERFRSTPVQRPRGPLAIVADHKLDELARLFMSMTSKERPAEIFRSIHEARRWLLETSKLPF